jgi:hypothetical protein
VVLLTSKSRTSPPRTRVRKNEEEDAYLDEIETLSPMEQETIGQLSDVLTTTLQRVGQSANTTAFLEAIANNNLAQANFVLSWAELGDAVAILEQILYAQMRAGGALGLPAVSVGFNYQFSATNVLAIRWAKQEAAKRIAELTFEQQGLVRQTIVDALTGAYDVREVARIVQQSIGLHSRWAKAVETRYQRTLAGYLESGIPMGRATAMAREVAMRYHDELLRSRSTMIARTEILAAHNAGRWFTFEDAIGAGIAPRNALKKWVTRVPQRSGGTTLRWTTASGRNRSKKIAYDSPCDDCLPYNGVMVPWSEPFDNGVMMPPLHPNCVCTAVLIIPEQPDYLPLGGEPSELLLDLV